MVCKPYPPVELLIKLVCTDSKASTGDMRQALSMSGL
jgi:hypothetical protein